MWNGICNNWMNNERDIERTSDEATSVFIFCCIFKFQKLFFFIYLNNSFLFFWLLLLLLLVSAIYSIFVRKKKIINFSMVNNNNNKINVRKIIFSKNHPPLSLSNDFSTRYSSSVRSTAVDNNKSWRIEIRISMLSFFFFFWFLSLFSHSKMTFLFHSI